MVETPLIPRFRSIIIKRWWGIPEGDKKTIGKFPVGTLLRPGGWILIGCRPSEVKDAIGLLSGWGLEFGTLAFRRHYPYASNSNTWKKPKHHILAEDLQEVIVIGFKGPLTGWLHRKFRARTRPLLTNYPTRWEYNTYWKFSQFWGYPRLEIWARPYEGVYPPRWTRIGPYLDGMSIGQSLWLEHAKRFSTHLDTSWLASPGGS